MTESPARYVWLFVMNKCNFQNLTVVCKKSGNWFFLRFFSWSRYHWKWLLFRKHDKFRPHFGNVFSYFCRALIFYVFISEYLNVGKQLITDSEIKFVSAFFKIPFFKATEDIFYLEGFIFSYRTIIVRVNMMVKLFIWTFSAHENIVYFRFVVKIYEFIVNPVFFGVTSLRYESCNISFYGNSTHVFLNTYTLIAFNYIESVHILKCNYRITLTEFTEGIVKVWPLWSKFCIGRKKRHKIIWKCSCSSGCISSGNKFNRYFNESQLYLRHRSLAQNHILKNREIWMKSSWTSWFMSFFAKF